jgi:hypothetical protein
LDDPSRVSNQDPEKKDVDKLVRSLTTLTKEKEIPTLTADFFDSGHPLPKVCVLKTQNFWILFFLFSSGLYVMSCFFLFLRITNSWFLTLLSPRGGQLEADPAPSNSEALEADECRGGDDAIDSQEGSGSTTLPPSAISEDKGLEKKRKGLDDLVSSCTSNLKDASGEPAAVDTSGFKMFDALDS